MLRTVATILICTGITHAEEARISVPDFGIKDVPASQLSPTQRFYALQHVLCEGFKAGEPMPTGPEEVRLWMAQQIACTPSRPKPE